MKQIVVFSICFGLVPAVLSFAGDKRTKSTMQQMDINVRDMSGLRSLRPVTGGIPLAQGAAPEGAYTVRNQ